MSFISVLDKSVSPQGTNLKKSKEISFFALIKQHFLAWILLKRKMNREIFYQMDHGMDYGPYTVVQAKKIEN